MFRIHFFALFLVLSFLALTLPPIRSATAQFSGSRGGIHGGTASHVATDEFPKLSAEEVQSYITVEGRAELRVVPTEIRIVLAITAERETPGECKQEVDATIKILSTAWQDMGVAKDNIAEDFIAVLPRYDFEIERVRNQEVAMEKKTGFIMQSNLHIAVTDDAQAMQVITKAFEHGVADIIAFDYWSKELDAIKMKARAAAVKAARDKSDTLLTVLFDKRPPVINLQEATRVHYPESLYESFTNTNDGQYQTSHSRRDIPQIRMYRPKNTYYRGLYLDGDVQPKELPMRSEISVVSTVRLFFESPAAKDYRSASSK